MSKTVLCFFHLFMVATLWGQTADTIAPAEFPMVAYWNKGEVLEYEVIKGKKTLLDDKLMDSTARSTTLTLTIIDSTEKSYLIDIGYSADLSLEEMGLDPMDVQKLYKKFSALRFRYETDETGAFKDYQNLDQLSMFYSDVFDMVMKKKELTAEQKMSIQQLRAVMTTENYIRQKSLEEIPLLHNFYGKIWPLDTILQFPDALPNAFVPSEVIPAISELSFELDAENDQIGYIFYNTSVEQAAMENIIAAYIKTINMSGVTAEDVKAMTLNMQDFNTYVVDMNYGTVLGFYRERVVKANNTTTVQFIDINLK